MSETKLRWFKKGGAGAAPILQYKDIDSWGISGEWKDVPLVVEEESLNKLGPWPTIQAQPITPSITQPQLITPIIISAPINLNVEKEVTVGDPYGLG